MISLTQINSSDVFSFIECSPLANELENSFTKFLEELKLNIDYNLEPCFLYFANDTRINAFASRVDNINIIGINVGLVEFLTKMFLHNTSLKTRLTKSKTIPYSDLMYETAMHFTFYHELGHLLQHSNHLENTLTENSQSEFSMEKHILEFDADEFSSVLVAGNIAGFSIKNFGKKLNKEEIEEILVIISASIVFYLLSFEHTNQKMYYRECTHPHPTIRIVNIIQVLLTHFQDTLETYKIQIDIDSNKIARMTMDLSEQICGYGIGSIKSERIKIMRQSIMLEHENISEYIEFLRTSKRGNLSMSTHKWNIYAKSRLKNNKA